MKRLIDESYKDYRIRRLKDQKKLKVYLKGHVWWSSSILGVFNREVEAK